MIQYDNSSLYFKAMFDYETIVVPANTTFKLGTVLGEISNNGKLTQFKSQNNDGSEIPMAILNKELINNTENEIEFSNISVIVNGEINSNKLIFNATDNSNTIIDFIDESSKHHYRGKVKTLLKNNGIFIILNQNLTY